MTPEQARQRAADVLGDAVGCRPLNEFADDFPGAMPAAVVTDEIPMQQAVALYSQSKRERARSGLSPLLVTRSGFEHLQFKTEARPHLESALAEYEIASADTFFAERLQSAGDDPGGAFEAALDALGGVAGCDPMSILHRIRPDYLAAAEEGEDGAIDEDELLPDDVRAAHAQVLAEREAQRELAGRSPGPRLVQVQPVRCYDEASTLAELSGGPARVVLVASTPAQALLHLGFGGFNACPSPHEQARVWEHWARTLGAEPVLLDDDRLEGVIERPASSRESLVAFAREIALYDRDAMMEGALALLGTLYRSAHVAFWWD